MDTKQTSDRIAGLSLNKAAVIAGVSLLIMAVLAPIANFAILNRLIVPGNAAETAGNVVDSEGLFRLAIFIFMIVAILDIVVAWALYEFLRPVHKSLSLLAAWFRLVYATILIAVSIFLLNALHLLSGAGYLSALPQDHLQAQVMLSLNRFTFGWDFGLIVFGSHLLLLGCLLYKAGYMRKILGLLVLLASLGYLIDGLGKILFSGYDFTVSLYTFVGELVLIFWLLLKGAKIN